MKIEIKGSWHNRKLLIDGKDVTNTSDDTDTYTRKSLIAGDRTVTNIKLKKRSGKNA